MRITFFFSTLKELRVGNMKFSLLAITCMLLSGCGKEQGLMVSLPPEGSSYAMITGSLQNNTAETLVFEELTSTVAEHTELHENIGSENEMMMRKVRNFELAPGETLQLDHGGKHIMLINLNQQLEVGKSFKVFVPGKKEKAYLFDVAVKGMHH